jgi:hypothetical protein
MKTKRVLLGFTIAPLLVTGCATSHYAASGPVKSVNAGTVPAAHVQNVQAVSVPDVTTSCVTGWEDNTGIFHAGNGNPSAVDYSGSAFRATFTNMGTVTATIGSYQIVYIDTSGDVLTTESEHSGGYGNLPDGGMPISQGQTWADAQSMTYTGPVAGCKVLRWWPEDSSTQAPW